jgi:hypothetical protein
MRLIAKAPYHVNDIASVWFANSEKKKNWINRCEDFYSFSKIQEWKSNSFDVFENVTNFVSSNVRLISGRMFVTRHVTVVDKQARAINGFSSSVRNPENFLKFEKKDQAAYFKKLGKVLGEIPFAYSYMAAAKEPNQTDLDFSIQVDPKGSIPEWAVNLVAGSWPEQTYDNLMTFSKSDDFEKRNYFPTISRPQSE